MLKFFRIPFAQSGDKTAVPDAVDVNGFVSYTAGYGFDYQRQKTDPAAKNIERDKMNEIFFDITTALAELQSQGIPDFITSALNGGTAYSYGQYAVVRYSGDIYVSLVAANTATPADLTKWALLPVPSRLQSALNTRATAAGTADAITATFTPAITALPAAPNTLSLMVRAGAANTIAGVTFSPDGLTAKTIVKGANGALVPGDIAGAGHWLHLNFDPTLDKWVLQNPAYGVNAVTVKQIQTVGATVAANALTLSLATTSLDFRSATAGSGVVNTRTVPATISLVVPSGATLGTVSGVSARLALIAIDNAGTVELAVTNLAGGNVLDETGVINTTAISGASNASNVYYSTTARTGVPYRVVGFIDISEATAGTWATAPATIQGVGGQALAALSSIGYGQNWQAVTRNAGTTYYNTTGKPIMFAMTYNYVSGTCILTVNGAEASQAGGAGGYGQICGIIPPGAAYSYSLAGNTLINTKELR